MRIRISALAALALTISLTGCSTGSTDADSDSTADAGSGASSATCDTGALDTLTSGKLTVGTSTPYEPWYVGEDATSGKGFESALVYQVADKLGYDADSVEWTQVTFEQMISPAIKPFDFAAYQTTITPERAKVVDFSSPYLDTHQGVVVTEKGSLADATQLSDFDGKRIGVTAGQTSLPDSKAAWGDSVKIVPYDEAGMAMQALTNGQIDAVVMDASQAVAAATTYYPDSKVVGTLPDSGDPAQLGLVLDKDSPLTACVSQAVDELRQDGTLDKLASKWLKSGDLTELK